MIKEKNYFQEGELYLNKKQYKKAVSSFTNAIKEAPENIKGILGLAKAYQGLGNHQKAVFELNKIVKMEPDAGETYFELGRVYFSQQKNKLAEDMFLKAVKLDPSNINARLFLADLYIIAKKYEDAESQIKQALDLAAGGKIIDYDKTYLKLGEVYFARGKYDLAAKELTRVIESNPENSYAHYFLAKSYDCLGNADKAADECEKVLNSGFKDNAMKEGIYLIMLKKHFAGKQYGLAVDKLKEILKINPSNTQARIMLARSYQYIKKPREAVKQYMELVKQEDSNIDVKADSKQNAMLKNIFLNEVEMSQGKTVLKSKVRRLIVMLTNKCNLNCIMCGVVKHDWVLPEKTKKEIMELLPFLEEVMWVGGEVFLYKGFNEILDEASKYPVKQIIVTNALMLNSKIAKKLLSGNININISIDGVTKEVYEHIRKGASFDKLISNINMINKLKKQMKSQSRLFMNTVVMESNYRQLEGFVEFAKKHNFSRIFLNNLSGDTPADVKKREDIYAGADKTKLDFVGKAREKVKLKCAQYGIDLVDILPEYSGVGKKQPKKTGGKKSASLFCHMPWRNLIVDHNGYVRYECWCHTDRFIGNINKNTIEEIWNGKKAQEYRTKILAGNYKKICSFQCINDKIPYEIRTWSKV